MSTPLSCRLQDHIHSEEFLRYFSADISVIPDAEAWCTPYAVSVHGQGIAAPDQFNGRGYGDGRAAAVGEFRGATQSWELQLKGAGTSPFSRGFDGRAVLRSSVREFLVSEAMHHLGVPTTRALSLAVSGTESVQRAWYGEGDKHNGAPPMRPVEEPCAICCRAAKSFLRVGQFELFSRRMRTEDPLGEADLRSLVEYALKREDIPHDKEAGVEEAIISLVRFACARHSYLVTQWLRVGYVQAPVFSLFFFFSGPKPDILTQMVLQGNMNSDNCLLGGLTMDYGPFGFMEK